MTYSLPRAYGGVTFFASLVSGNYLLARDIEKHQRKFYFEEDGGLHERSFSKMHMEQTGDSLASDGLPDDGSSFYVQAKGYSVWYL